MDFRSAKTSEAPRLSEIAFEAKRHWGYPAEWMELWRPDLTVSSPYLENEKVHVAEVDGVVIGFAGLSWGERGRQIEHLWVMPSHMGRGVGRKLFAEMVRCAREENIRELSIWSDPNAEAFYLKMGAVRVGEERYLMPGGTSRELPLLVFRMR